MIGPEHYKEAERLLAEHAATLGKIDATSTAAPICVAVADSLLATAQVHATLALAAAMASMQASSWDGDESHTRSRGWASVI